MLLIVGMENILNFSNGEINKVVADMLVILLINDVDNLTATIYE